MDAKLATVHDRYSATEIAAYYEAGLWEPASFTELAARQAAARPDRPFLIDSTSSVTFAEFRDRALRLAVGLRRSGISRGDRVAVQLPNWTEFPVLAAALSRLGAILVPIMPIYREDEVAYVLRHSGAVAAVTCGEFRKFDHLGMFAGLLQEIPGLRQVYLARPDRELDPAVATPLSDLVAEGSIEALEAEAGPDSSPDDGFLIVYTSGTTSRPKGCFHTFNTLRASAAAIAEGLRYSERDVQFGPSPITHSTGLVTSVVLPLLKGATSCLMEVFEPEAALRWIERYGCTAAVTATPFLQMLMSAYDPEKHDASSLRFWVCAGSPIPGAVIAKAGELFPGCRTLSLYGRSENMLTTMCTAADPAGQEAHSDGAAVAGAQVEVVDQDGREVPRGEEGDIAYRGPSHMLEYFRDEAQTEALFTPDGFSRSGDLGRMDAEGYVRVTGRLKDIVIRGGMNISAREVEDHLADHPGIAGVAVVGMPDERLGEKVCAYVTPAGPGAGPTLREITDFLRARHVAVQKLPERLEVVSELPMTATGKVKKHELREDIRKKLASA
ncbi:AMP-binding protein [Amycolatopsis sp. NBC_01480]|uniref:AMP-binding protein n=1 Tax=Amycolatopsis sp. NBC_01480 TaxID=2903562 RepID=UPI002E283A15|nr:AMP-binding protein [Amycolatopsis sp. NBC_01480]